MPPPYPLHYSSSHLQRSSLWNSLPEGTTTVVCPLWGTGVFQDLRVTPGPKSALVLKPQPAGKDLREVNTHTHTFTLARAPPCLEIPPPSQVNPQPKLSPYQLSVPPSSAFHSPVTAQDRGRSLALREEMLQGQASDEEVPGHSPLAPCPLSCPLLPLTCEPQTKWPLGGSCEPLDIQGLMGS